MPRYAFQLILGGNFLSLVVLQPTKVKKKEREREREVENLGGKPMNETRCKILLYNTPSTSQQQHHRANKIGQKNL